MPTFFKDGPPAAPQAKLPGNLPQSPEALNQLGRLLAARNRLLPLAGSSTRKRRQGLFDALGLQGMQAAPPQTIGFGIEE